MTSSSLRCFSTAAIISTGTEILQGLYPDTNARFLAEQLTAMGVEVKLIAAAPDEITEIENILRFAASKADLVICSGGLGPTVDDVNRFVYAQVFGLTLERDEKAIGMMRERFIRRGRGAMPASNEVQGMVPRESVVFYNEWGTAPGFFVPPLDERGENAGQQGANAALVALPGPPKEMMPMFEKYLRPILAGRTGGRRYARTRTIHTYGQAESSVNDRLKDLFTSDSRVRVTILAKVYGIDLRVHASATDEMTVENLIQQFEQQVRERLGPEEVYGVDEDTLAVAVAKLLWDRNETLALAESCTGGLVAKLLTDIPGSSAYLKQGYIVYANEAKQQVLGVPADLLEKHGAVSREVAMAMARGARENAATNYAIAITGIAGPGGGSAEKPVGLTYIAIANGDHCWCAEINFTGDRELNRLWAAQSALAMLRQHLLRPQRPNYEAVEDLSSPTP